MGITFPREVSQSTPPPMRVTSGALARVDEAKRLLDSAETLTELKALEVLFAGVVAYAQRARKTVPVINHFAVFHLDCQRKAGRLLAGIERADGGRPAQNASHRETSFQRAIREAGIPMPTAYRWQLMSLVPDDAFTEWCKAMTKSDQLVTAKSLLDLVRRRRPLHRRTAPDRVILLLPTGTRSMFMAQCRSLFRRYGTADITETIVRAIEEVARLDGAVPGDVAHEGR